jgi:hypothetical protein
MQKGETGCVERRHKVSILQIIDNQIEARACREAAAGREFENFFVQVHRFVDHENALRGGSPIMPRVADPLLDGIPL